MKRPSTWPVLGAVLLSACADNPSARLPLETRAASMAQVTLQGQVRGPGGSSVCNHLPPGARMRVYAIDRSTVPDERRQQPVNCPDDTYDLTVREGTDWVLLVVQLGDPLLLPLKYIDPAPFTVSGPTIHNVQINRGRALSGRATLHGVPIGEVPLDVTTPLTDFEAGVMTYGVSAADGTWREGARALSLQTGAPYNFFCRALLGTKPVQNASNTTNYPSAGGSATCKLADSESLRFSHDATRMVVTANSGAFGGNVNVNQDFGWGVQYLIPPVTQPSHSPYASILPLGGLLIEVGGRVMSTFYAGNVGFCTDCADVGYEAGPGVAVTGDARRVTWTLSDDNEPVPVGIRMQQISYDGTGGDYVIVNLRFTNTSAATYDLNVGMGYDWDVRGVVDNVAAVTLNGRLAYVRDAQHELYVGTLFLGRYDHATNFVRPLASPAFTPTEQVALMRGELVQDVAAGPADMMAFQSAGPLNIPPTKTRHAWFAFVAGGSLAELQANGEAAQADYEARTGNPAFQQGGEPVGAQLVNPAFKRAPLACSKGECTKKR